MLKTISEATTASTVLLLHSPYPGRLMFRGIPSSMLAAATPFLLSRRGQEERVGYLDPVTASPAFYDRLGTILANGQVRVLCVSTSTAAHRGNGQGRGSRQDPLP